MTSKTTQAKAKLATLSSSLDELEAQLEPLFSQALPETTVGLEPIQQAKLQTVLPYVVYDLIFVYLKSKGIDPRTHPVIPELDRVRQYFEKIKSAENPPAKRTEIDKAAAGRFIKHAITQAKWTKTAAEDEESPEPSSSTPRVPIKVTSKMQERAQYEIEMMEKDAEGSKEEELEVFEGEDEAVEDEEEQPASKKGKNKAEPPSNDSGKRRRPAVDPFAGYGDDLAAQAALSKKSKSGTNSSDDAKPTESLPKRSSPSIVTLPATGSSTKTKKTKKKGRKSLT
ncbi:Sas10/Utp3/C1D family-domain-containing protein [Crucibulum laeve]|uniref:Exosome complex protein n=1 Tax=Crucibulum laeve TaxID=68775 RepID=A0A5C3M9D8_9AGAR|nr:Sas10/Utp3/C1D family-domain-containing protein [Crucibulum laeve]